MTAVDILFCNLMSILGLMLLGWIISLFDRNVTIADSLWGLGFVLVAWQTFLLNDGFAGRQLLTAVLASIWGFRLCIHLTLRNWGKSEDPRYGQWRKESGRKFWIVSLFKVFLLQAGFLWLVSLALQWAIVSEQPKSLTFLDLFGTIVWLTGFLFEAIGDWQLARFKAAKPNQGQVMDKGLWAYSRHPNYFGDALVWWGIYLIALSTPNSWWTAASPILITLVLVKITGVAMMERTIADRRPEYAEYIAKTNAFIPWFPKEKRKTR